LRFSPLLSCSLNAVNSSRIIRNRPPSHLARWVETPLPPVGTSPTTVAASTKCTRFPERTSERWYSVSSRNKLFEISESASTRNPSKPYGLAQQALDAVLNGYFFSSGLYNVWRPRASTISAARHPGSERITPQYLAAIRWRPQSPQWSTCPTISPR
jgi:hypothetical protein